MLFIFSRNSWKKFWISPVLIRIVLKELPSSWIPYINSLKFINEINVLIKSISNSININIDSVIVEYVDRVECSNGKIYTSSLVLCSSDYGISLIIPMEITPKNILNQM